MTRSPVDSHNQSALLGTWNHREAAATSQRHLPRQEERAKILWSLPLHYPPLSYQRHCWLAWEPAKVIEYRRCLRAVSGLAQKRKNVINFIRNHDLQLGKKEVQL